MLIASAVLIAVLLAAFPVTKTGKCLHRLMVEEPARRLNEISPGRIVFYLALGLAGLLMFVLFEAEGVRLFSFMAPDLILWFGMFDVALFLDAFVVAASLIATTRFRAIRTSMAAGLGRILVVARQGRASRQRSPRRRPDRTRGIDRDDPDPTWPTPWSLALS